MTVEEALEIVETALDYQRLNKVQELVFRQSWEGRSYIEIARSNDYEPDYIKDAGAKLWKLLSKALGEKVKKDNLKSALKRYLRRNQVNLQRNQLIGINLSGADLSGSILCFANLNGADSYPPNLPKAKIPDDPIESDETIINGEEENKQGSQFNSEGRIYHWKGFCFHSDAQVKIAEILDRTSTLFIPNSQLRLATPDGRQNLEADFLIFHQGKLGMLKIDSEAFDRNETEKATGDRPFIDSGICLVKHYDATQCSEQPDLVVQEFLEILSQA
jgi:uncharacterized protein YjbI with pentapeptide repeats